MSACSPKPFKGNTPSAEIAPYVDSFYEAWGGVRREIAYNMIPLEGKSAECVWNDEGVRIINVDPDVWDEFCHFKRKALIWHELGHCQLGRSHTTELSYMQANIATCQFIEDNEIELDEELFL
jgi:hypothetical protein